MEKRRVVIVDGVRTPFVRARSVFQNMPASVLGGIVLREIIARCDLDPHLVEEVYLGLVTPPGEGTHVAREALFDSGLSPSIACTTVNRYCASAGEAIAAMAAKILAGQVNVGIAGGMESLSSVQAFFSLEATHFFQDWMRVKTLSQRISRLRDFKVAWMIPRAPGIKEPTTGLSMGESADLMARAFKVSRKAQDQYALESHLKTLSAWERGFYGNHVVLVATPEGKLIERDTDIRADSSMEKLEKLKPVFYSEGTITAGNSSPLTDGAACVLLMSEEKAVELKLEPLGFIRSAASAGIDIQKEPLLIGPVFAIPKALKQAGVSWNEIDLIEMHEAFAGQVLATKQAIESKQWAEEKLNQSQPIGILEESKLNVNGGSIAIGHPFGATGARLLMQALYELRSRKKKLGLISICAAGGLGTVLIVEAF